MRWEDSFPSLRDCDLAPCLGLGKLGFKSGKTHHVRILQICIPPNPQLRVHLDLVLQMSESAGWAMQVWTWFAKVHVLFVASPSLILHHSQIPSAELHRLPCKIFMVQDQCGTFHKVTPILEEVGCPFWFICRNQRLTSTCGAVLAWGRDSAVSV